MVSSSLIDRRYRPSAHGFSLSPAATELYAAFARVPPPERVVHCPHCVSQAEIEALLGPVGALDAALVTKFVRKVGTTWGGPDDLRRVTPRVLTLAADHQLGISRALVWQQYRAAGWTTWPEVETAAIGRFLLAEFTRLLRAPARPAHVAHRWLAQVATGIDDLSGFLTVWHDALGPLPEPEIRLPAFGHLVELLTTSALRPDLPETMADVFALNPSVAPQVEAFLTGPGADLDLRRAAQDLADTPAARRINVAMDRLRRYRDAVSAASA